MERLVGSKTLQRLKTRTLPAGLRDVQELMGVTLTFRRRDVAGWADVLTTPAISIRLNTGQPLEAFGGVETTTRGTAKVWAAGVDDTPLMQGDQFVWDGHVCVVDLVAPVRLDTYVGIEFTLKEDN